MELAEERGVIISIWRDITERKRTENALMESEETLRKAQEIAHVGSWEWDIVNNTIRWSDETYRMFGWKPKEVDLNYEVYIERVFPEDREMVKQLVTEALGGKPYENEHRIIRINDGDVRVHHMIGKVYRDDNDNPIKMIGVVQDITERRNAEEEKIKLEAQLRQATKMQAVGTLAGGIAHEFNNMLGIIMGYTDIARYELPQDSFARTALDRVIEVSYRFKNLVKQILTFSRQSQQQWISANLCPLVKESVKLIQPTIPSSVEIQTNIDPDCGNTNVDPTEIQQIIMNLCSNAVWAMKEKGTLRIRQKEVHLTNHDELIPKGLSAGRYVKLSFSDTGCGIDQKTLPRIFDPFFTTKEVGQGTGMGLSIIYAIMESYGGAITVESEVGKGTTFHLYFRVMDEPAAEKQEQVEAIPRGNERILFVDDEEMYAKLGKEMLSRLGYDVDLKINSVEALEVFKAAPDNYDLVITDQVMPDLSGEELMKEIRTIRPDVPIILCTGYSTQMDEKKARSLGINEFAFKPIVMKDIAKLIRKVLDAS